MTTELKSEWVKALRSGEYKQGFGLLRVDKGPDPSLGCTHCSLGVLADVLVQKGAAMWGKNNRICYEGISNLTTIPGRLRKDIKLFGPFHDKVITMNDIRRYTFLEIADWIETNIDVEDTPAV